MNIYNINPKSRYASIYNYFAYKVNEKHAKIETQSVNLL